MMKREPQLRPFKKLHIKSSFFKSRGDFFLKLLYCPLTTTTTDGSEDEQYWGFGGNEGLRKSQIELIQKFTGYILERHPRLVTVLSPSHAVIPQPVHVYEKQYKTK